MGGRRRIWEAGITQFTPVRHDDEGRWVGGKAGREGRRTEVEAAGIGSPPPVRHDEDDDDDDDEVGLGRFRSVGGKAGREGGQSGKLLA